MLEISMDLVRQLKSDVTSREIEEIHITLLLLSLLKSAAKRHDISSKAR